MQILNNPAQVFFHKSPNTNHHTQQRAQSRPSSIHHPNVIFDSNIHQSQQTRHHHEQVIHIPKKVSFHYSNQNQQQNEIKTSQDQNKNIMFQQQYRQNRKMSEYSKQSNENNIPSIRYRINSTDQTSNASKQSAKNAMISSGIHMKNTNANQLNYPPTIFKKEQTKMEINHEFPRQRSRSSISSKSSTKLIVQTVRQVNQDGTRGWPIEVKHRIETQYLTNLNKNTRQNYIMKSENLPKHIIVNHNYHSPDEVRNFYSPQIAQVSGSLREKQIANGNFIMNHQHIAQQSNQSTAQKAKYSQVFSYPVRSSGHQNFIGNRIQTQTTGQYGSVNEHLRGFPITSESKFQNVPRKDHHIQTQRYQQSGHKSDLNKNFESAFQNQFTNNIHLHTNQPVYRGYGADITKEATHIQDLIQRPLYKERKDKRYVITSEMYSISQQLIDQIFRNQTQKALLKLNNIERLSPRKFFSPQVKNHRHNRSTEKKALYKRQHRQVYTNSDTQEQTQNRKMVSEETVKV